MSETAPQVGNVLDIAHSQKRDRVVALAFREWLDELDDDRPVDLRVPSLRRVRRLGPRPSIGLKPSLLRTPGGVSSSPLRAPRSAGHLAGSTSLPRRCFERTEPTHSLIVTDQGTKFRDGQANIERTGLGHRGNIDPVFRTVEECFEDAEVTC